MLDMWPWLVICGLVTAAVTYAYRLGVEVGREKR